MYAQPAAAQASTGTRVVEVKETGSGNMLLIIVLALGGGVALYLLATRKGKKETNSQEQANYGMEEQNDTGYASKVAGDMNDSVNW
jgi:uncharacterized protein HemX